MCPHCVLVALEILFGCLVALPVVGYAAARARRWVRRKHDHVHRGSV